MTSLASIGVQEPKNLKHRVIEVVIVNQQGIFKHKPTQTAYEIPQDKIEAAKWLIDAFAENCTRASSQTKRTTHLSPQNNLIVLHFWPSGQTFDTDYCPNTTSLAQNRSRKSGSHRRLKL